MRLGLFVLFAALLLATVAGQNSLLRSTDAETSTSAITACAHTGDRLVAAQGESCSQPSLDSTPGTVLSHVVYAGGCSQGDLHVVRYVPADSPDGQPVLATWCT